MRIDIHSSSQTLLSQAACCAVLCARAPLPTQPSLRTPSHAPSPAAAGSPDWSSTLARPNDGVMFSKAHAAVWPLCCAASVTTKSCLGGGLPHLRGSCDPQGPCSAGVPRRCLAQPSARCGRSLRLQSAGKKLVFFWGKWHLGGGCATHRRVFIRRGAARRMKTAAARRRADCQDKSIYPMRRWQASRGF